LDFEIKPVKVLKAINSEVLLVDKNSFSINKDGDGAIIDIGENVGAIINLKNNFLV